MEHVVRYEAHEPYGGQGCDNWMESCPFFLLWNAHEVARMREKSFEIPRRETWDVNVVMRAIRGELRSPVQRDLSVRSKTAAIQ